MLPTGRKRHYWSYAGGGEHWEGRQEEEPGWVLAAPGAPGDPRIHTTTTDISAVN